MGEKDLFSLQSDDYANYRPTYPDKLYNALIELVPAKSLAWDVACGTGQATVPLAGHFERVIGTDLSDQQLSRAASMKNIEYFQASAEDLENLQTIIEPGSVDLISVAQALHWFNFDKFYQCARSMLKPDGIVAVWTYTWPEIQGKPKLTKLLHDMAKVVLGPYWDPERALVDNHYRDVPFPFERLIESIEEPFAVAEQVWDLDHLFGYIRSWSAYQNSVKQTGKDLLEERKVDFEETWGDKTAKYQVHFPIFLLAGRNNK